MSGGQGNDTSVVDNVGDIVNENPDEGIDLVQSGISYALTDNVENLVLTGSGKLNGTGNALDNILLGNDADNALSGLAGNDTLISWGCSKQVKIKARRRSRNRRLTVQVSSRNPQGSFPINISQCFIRRGAVVRFNL